MDFNFIVHFFNLINFNNILFYFHYKKWKRQKKISCPAQQCPAHVASDACRLSEGSAWAGPGLTTFLMIMKWLTFENSPIFVVDT